uniref:Uncharacterized protein n=1 Tax=Xiphophorus couchianus TaxID=32473 RepID=A0A3B5MQV8_9TELE
ISLTLVNPSILPVGLPCASCVWNTSLGRKLAGGGGSPAPFTADLPGLPCSFVALFFFFHGPYGIQKEGFSAVNYPCVLALTLLLALCYTIAGSPGCHEC